MIENLDSAGLADGETEAQQYIDEAKKQAAQMVSETAIMQAAEQEAEKLINDAQEQIKEMQELEATIAKGRALLELLREQTNGKTEH